MEGEARRAAVLGHPVAHSLSPALHRAAYAALGLRGWRYDAVDVTEAQLPDFIAGLGPEWAGLSLTMPLKRAVLPVLDDLSELAGQLQVVNTVTFTGGRRVGHNTDVHGLVAALRSAGVSAVGSGCVLGGGATTVSALAALRELGCLTPTVFVRSPDRAGALRETAQRLGVQPKIVAWDGAREALSADVTISTVPAGATDGLATELERGGEAAGLLLDVVYAPWPTGLARAWQARGGVVVGGSEMLLHQAAAQVELMTGRAAPLEAMRTALEAAHRASEAG